MAQANPLRRVHMLNNTPLSLVSLEPLDGSVSRRYNRAGVPAPNVRASLMRRCLLSEQRLRLRTSCPA